MSSNHTVKKIRATGPTFKSWCELHGFKYQTAIKVVHGYVGKRQIGIAGEIIRQLKNDGFLGEEV